MRDIQTQTNSTSPTFSMDPNGTSFWEWKSPLPYLFGGLALTLALIVVALVLLACSSHQRYSSDDEDKSTSPSNKSATIVEMSPRVIVIMAGDQKPTHIGVPISSSAKPSDYD
ncbi:hypothetical protein RND71_011439 [Anisodus tanguticus]|uniref:Uncharacterized protein n=1 Tax=Anisodus tanguticus TaxID=243964 RepID=A0AAE1SDH7_9SOLA|nr:hypothetical protein RND71_011439 [Anisodus tanguticus]